MLGLFDVTTLTCSVVYTLLLSVNCRFLLSNFTRTKLVFEICLSSICQNRFRFGCTTGLGIWVGVKRSRKWLKGSSSYSHAIECLILY